MRKIIAPLLALSFITMMITSCQEDSTVINPDEPFLVVQVDGEESNYVSIANSIGASASLAVATNQEASTIEISVDSDSQDWLKAWISNKTITLSALTVNESTVANRKGYLTITAADDASLSIEVTVVQAAALEQEEDTEDQGDYDGDYENDYQEDPDLPAAGALEAYTYSPTGKLYYPVTTKYKGNSTSSYVSAKARIVPYLYNFEADYTNLSYSNTTNGFGSSTVLPQQEATGRFYTKKIGDRWWVVDPEGYLHHHRAVNSVNLKDEEYLDAWNRLFGGDTIAWLTQVRDEFHDLGYHGTGAFGTGLYESYMKINSQTPDQPLTYAPSMSMLSAFRKTDTTKNAYPDGDSSNEAGLVLYDGWAEFCMEYIAESLTIYKGDPNLFGIFSDNEVSFTSNSNNLLERFLDISDKTNIAYTTASEFMEEYGLGADSSLATTELNDVFECRIGELYYKAIRDAIKALDPDMLYLGSRLHGAAKYSKGLVMAAAKYCDIISINYYSRWDPDYSDEWEQWAEEATDGVGCPFFVTEFYTQASEIADLVGTGAGFIVPTFKESGFAYHHFTLGLLEAKNCVGWHYFAYSRMISYDYELNEDMTDYMRRLNYNAYNLIEYFDN